jgi:DNA-directed RNA polymerase subunit L
MSKLCVKVISRTKDTLEIELQGANDTLVQPLIERLQNDDDVAMAHHSVNHLIADPPKIYIKMKSGTPQAALKRAIKSIVNEYKAMEEAYLSSKVL